MKLGSYEFEWVPDEMGIPRPEKTTAVAPNLGNVGFFSWGPQLIGKEVKLKWKFTSVAQYEAFRAMYLAGGTHVLDLSSETIYIPPPPSGEPVPIAFQGYPDPSYPGAIPGPPYKRFYVGHSHSGPFHVNVYAYWNWSWIGDTGWPNYNGTVRVINSADPLNSYIELSFDPYSTSHLPDWRVGDTIFDNGGYNWATVVPWNSDLRAYYIYPASPSATDKIYYSNVINSFYPYAANTLQVGNEIWLDSDSYPTTGRCIITELGSDDFGTWFRCEAKVGYRLILWTAGNIGHASSRSFNVKPWGPVVGGPFG